MNNNKSSPAMHNLSLSSLTTAKVRRSLKSISKRPHSFRSCRTRNIRLSQTSKTKRSISFRRHRQRQSQSRRLKRHRKFLRIEKVLQLPHQLLFPSKLTKRRRTESHDQEIGTKGKKKVFKT